MSDEEQPKPKRRGTMSPEMRARKAIEMSQRMRDPEMQRRAQAARQKKEVWAWKQHPLLEADLTAMWLFGTRPARIAKALNHRYGTAFCAQAVSNKAAAMGLPKRGLPPHLVRYHEKRRAEREAACKSPPASPS